MKSNINSFTFYFDYYNLIDTLPIEDKKILLVAITDYVFKDIEPKLEGHNQAIFNTLKAQLNVSKNNSKRRTKKEPEENQIETGKEPNIKPEQNKTSILSFIFDNYIYLQNRGLLRGKIEEWIQYKEEKGKPYNAYSLKSLLNRIETKLNQFGEDKIIKLIDYSLSNGYDGLIWENLGRKTKEQPIPDWFQKEVERKEYEFSDEDKKRFGIT